MKNVIIQCDRCGTVVHGTIEDIPLAGLPTCTSGFFDLREEIWKGFAREGEIHLCLNCMKNEPTFQMQYRL